jgi:hypothetical protein
VGRTPVRPSSAADPPVGLYFDDEKICVLAEPCHRPFPTATVNPQVRSDSSRLADTHANRHFYVAHPADHGKFHNPEKFGDLENGLYEFKSFQIEEGQNSKEEITRAWRIYHEDQARNSMKF